MQIADSEAFDILAPANLQEPFPLFAKLRQEKPVYWSEKYSFWLLTRYRDVKAAFRAPRQFSSATGAEIEKRRADFPEWVGASFDLCKRFVYGQLQAADPPEHTEQRHAVMGAFTPQVVGELRAAVQQRVDGLLDKMERGTGVCDFVSEFAYPLPSIVIFDLLGAPAEYHEILQRASRGLADFPIAMYGKDGKRIQEIAMEFTGAERAINEIIKMRRIEPKNDLISHLVSNQGAAAEMSAGELVVLCNFLLFAGHETTANLLAGSLRYLLESRELWDQLRAAPDMIPAAVEELLRFVSPVLWISRVAAEDIELNGEVLRKGQRIQLGIGAANHDPDEFDHPEQLDFTRPKVNSLAFGYGPHFCVGSALARMEAQVALSRLLDRIPNVELGTRQFEYRPLYLLRALKSLPIVIRR
ncbi:MAG TPA: cytochrome P450 [Chthoniobacterales bacterium]